MAGEVALSAFFQVTFEKLSSSVLKEFGLFKDLHKDIEKLKDTLLIIQGVLADAEKKQQKNQGVKKWLQTLKAATYDADDILDVCQTEALRRKLETKGQRQIINKARDFFSVSNPILFDLRMAHRVKKIGSRLDEICKKGNELGLTRAEQSSQVERSRDETDSDLNVLNVKGRKEDKKKIVELLLHNNMRNQDEKVWTMSITGMGGLGKTTLAQFVYNDAEIEKRFDLRIWACVSDDYDMIRLTRKIIESATKRECDAKNMELLQDNLKKELTGKKFLLVLDDVWHKNGFEWDRLKSYLRAGEMGSKILVTTRSEEDARIIGTDRIYQLSELSHDDCWDLFSEKAFGPGDEVANPKIREIGEQIVRRCRGVPLAITAVGSSMRCKRGEVEWKAIADSEIWDDRLLGKHDTIFPALRLSYNDLPLHLKPCFAFCAIFPKDWVIDIDLLIAYWMAQGLISQTSQENGQMEDIGREYFRNLLWRSFFQVAEEDCNDEGNPARCKMHDLMHDLAVSVSEDARSVESDDEGRISIPDGCRHLFVRLAVRKQVSIMPSDLAKAKKLRTLVIYSYFKSASHNLLSHSPRLRLLSVGNEATTNLLKSISRLKQLRYLYFGASALPNSLSKLYNLQTLSCAHSMLKELPRDMSKMVNLRHLYFSRYFSDGSLTSMPRNLGELTCLQSLPTFIVGEDSGRDVTQLSKLKYLRGDLMIEKLENVRDGENASEAMLCEKANLRSLGFSWSEGINNDAGKSLETLEGLRPHSNLRSLQVKNYAGERFPRWMSYSCLPNLVELSLSECSGCDELIPLGQFRSLKSVKLEGLLALKCVGSDFYGDHDSAAAAFPFLEKIFLRGMRNLEEWSDFSGVFPNLKELEVIDCPKFTTATALSPSFPLLSKLRLSGLETQSLSETFLFKNQQLTTPLLSLLEIDDCPDLESLSKELGKLAATLEELHIDGCNMLASVFPEEIQDHDPPSRPRLRKLSFQNCDGLATLKLPCGFTSLTTVCIWSCRNLASFVVGETGMHALQVLVIESCPNLDLGSLPYENLVRFGFGRYKRVTRLPESLKHATRLESLEISSLPDLAALPHWIGNLSSLQRFSAFNCPQLLSLPPEFQQLTSLQSLSIWGCPELARRCQERKGEDWHKISHIPYRSIDQSFKETSGIKTLIPTLCLGPS